MLKPLLAIGIAALLADYRLAHSQQHSPDANKPSSDNTQKANAGQPGTENYPFVIKILPATEAAPNAHKEDHESAEKLTIDKRLAFETERIADYTKGLVGATLLLVIATGLLWIFTGFMWNAIRREFNATHRPRMRIKHLTLVNPIVRDEPILLRVSIVNFGGTPARITNFVADIFFMERLSKLPPLPPFYASKRGGEIARPIGAGRTTLIQNHPVSTTATQNDADSIRRGTDVYCAGAIEYIPNTKWARLRIRSLLGRAPHFMTTAFCRKLELADIMTNPRYAGRFIRMEKDDEDYEYQD